VIDAPNHKDPRPARIQFEGAVHPPAGSRSRRLVTVVLPIKNGGRHAGESVRLPFAVEAQDA